MIELNRMNQEQELPQGWVWTNVEATGQLIRGVTYSNTDVLSSQADEALPLLRANNIQGQLLFEELVYVRRAVVKDEQIIRKNDIVIAMSSGSKNLVGKSAQAKADFAGGFGAFCGVFRPKEAIDAQYLGQFFTSPEYRKVIADLSAGSNINNLKREHINDMAFPLPPLPEQRRIVAKLEELFSKLDAGVAAVRRTQALLKRYRQSVLHAAVTGELTRAWREAHPAAPTDTGAALLQRIRAERRAQWEAAQVAKRGGQLPLGEGWKSKYVEPEAVDTAGLPELPEGWAWEKLELLTSLITKGASPTWQGFNYVTDEQVLFVTSENVRSSFLDVSRPKYLEWAFNNKQKASVLQEGDLLLNIVGASIGRAAMYNLTQPANINQAVSLIRLTLVDLREYVMLFLNSNQAIQFYNAEKVDVARANLSLKDVANIPIALPQSFDELRVVLQEMQRRLSVIDDLEVSLTAELKRAERLRQSVLHRAFTGRLVPQDATDEPAAALLARLRETATAPAKAKAGRGRKVAPGDQTALF